jgi:hypothetical protein
MAAISTVVRSAIGITSPVAVSIVGGSGSVEPVESMTAVSSGSTIVASTRGAEGS